MPTPTNNLYRFLSIFCAQLLAFGLIELLSRSRTRSLVKSRSKPVRPQNGDLPTAIGGIEHKSEVR